ncbi:MAG: FmdB family zinc ribbon protein [Acidobacteriota bacterium]
MPLFEYQCQSCGERIEVIQRHDAPPPGQCEKCGGALKKLLSAPAIQFKGSGFYKTDYASASSAAPSSSKSDSGSSGEPSSAKPAETKSDSKSESKSESKPPAKSESKASNE